VKIDRYQAHKDSDIEWLSEVPKTWNEKRVKDVGINGLTNGIFKKKDDFGFGIKLVNVSDLYEDNNVIRYDQLDRVNVDRHEAQRYSAINGDIFFVRSSLKLEGIGVSSLLDKAEESTVFECHIIRFRPNLKLVFPQFFKYLLNTESAKWKFIVASKTVTMTTISQEKISSIEFSSPPLPEQKSIAHYLDTKTAQIDRKIDLLTQKATQYSNLKQSLINETVTRGLDKSVPMKDSAIEWIGEVPEHWDINKLSQSFGQIGSGTTPKSGDETYYEDGTINWINTGDLNDDILTDCKRKVTPKALKDHSLTIYPVGSIAIAMYGATIGKVSVLNIAGCTNQACCVLNKSKNLDIKFLFYWFLSKRAFIVSLSYGGGQPNISQDTVKSLRVCAPPLSEQKMIANYLDTKTTQIDRIIQTLNTQIEKLKELRKTLINDVVTGKIRVIEDDPSSRLIT
jgi:type I restriction enzyme, S subunit